MQESILGIFSLILLFLLKDCLKACYQQFFGISLNFLPLERCEKNKNASFQKLSRGLKVERPCSNLECILHHSFFPCLSFLSLPSKYPLNLTMSQCLSHPLSTKDPHCVLFLQVFALHS